MTERKGLSGGAGGDPKGGSNASRQGEARGRVDPKAPPNGGRIENARSEGDDAAPPAARLNAARLRAAALSAQMGAVEGLLLTGATPWEIDEAAIAAGWPIGPCEAEDLVGLHIAYEARQAAGGPAYPVADRMVREGRVGKIGGVGWYRYPGGGGAVIDPLIEDLIREEARFATVEEAPPLAPAEIARRLALAVLVGVVGALPGGFGQDRDPGAEPPQSWRKARAALAPPFPAPQDDPWRRNAGAEIAALAAETPKGAPPIWRLG